ncbi:cysteine hydrolase family protein [Pacificoceanicola onchidii]|uniref:cysteine hydrolase family protein n=1 Tax=Pacificoceanicola onchidii TaxID=2562685 RepID=UPI0010A65F38|nr:isochorismatase family cysteine hydrolase [Pacificoceanicola onchidii]
MTIAYVLGAATLLILLWLGNGIRRIGAVSTGDRIADRTGSALLLIDLQTVFWDHGPYSEDAKSAAAAAILAEASAARAQNVPVIALRQEWSIPSTKILARLTMKGQALEGTDGTELAPPFAPLPDHVLVKRVQDGFETGALDTLLARLDVGALRLVGLDLNYCVLKTALAARNRGYHVQIVKSGTLAAAATDRAEHALTSSGTELC